MRWRRSSTTSPNTTARTKQRNSQGVEAMQLSKSRFVMSASILFAANLALADAATPAAGKVHDVVLHGGSIYDGSGGKPYPGDVAIDGERIAYVGPKRDWVGRIDRK